MIVQESDRWRANGRGEHTGAPTHYFESRIRSFTSVIRLNRLVRGPWLDGEDTRPSSNSISRLWSRYCRLGGDACLGGDDGFTVLMAGGIGSSDWGRLLTGDGA